MNMNIDTHAKVSRTQREYVGYRKEHQSFAWQVQEVDSPHRQLRWTRTPTPSSQHIHQTMGH
jgi:hypothetical protein